MRESEPVLVLADTEAGTFKAMRNPAADAHRRSGRKAAEAVIDTSTSAVIGTHFGHTAYPRLAQAGIAVHQAQGGVVRELVAACQAGQLPRLREQDPCDHPANDRACGR